MNEVGVIADSKSFLGEKAKAAAKKVGEGIASASVLNPKQLQDLDEKRRKYLSAKPDANGQEAISDMQKKLGVFGIEVYQAYLEDMKKTYSPVSVLSEAYDEDNRIRYFDITKWVTDAEEQSIDKLINVYHVLCEEDCNIALIYHRTKNKCQVTLGVANTNERQSDPAIADNFYMRVVGAVAGNFPGADIHGMSPAEPKFGIGIPACLAGASIKSRRGSAKSVAVVSNVPSEKSEHFISQSMEKLLDGIVPENEAQEYTIVLLAKPITDQAERKNRLYEMYSGLSPYAGWQTGYTYTESDIVNSSATGGMNAGMGMDAHVGVPGGPGGGISANFGVSFARSSGVSAQVGKNESISKNYTNYGVKHTLEMIEAQLKRMEESSALGMWDFAAYIISESPVVANNVAHMYLALTQGEESYLSKAAVNFWDGDIEPEAAKTILTSVRVLNHPVFGLKTSLEDEWLMYPTLVTPAISISGKELARALNFPRKSVSGLPVMEVASFGREPHTLSGDVFDLEIGNAYHMRKQIPGQRVCFSKEELTKHTFITGSTGSGKSNTIYCLLDKLHHENVKFLVVEPAKGEYRDKLGRQNGVTTYGTNPNLTDTQMLRINPFRFPKHTHILEHLDRLVEIFNVCWPMYAAMPAILKDAVERAYISSGWDLERSANRYDENLFPSFDDVAREIKLILDESDYSADNKGDYIGSLVTRLRSLTNGISGLIFTTDDVEDKELFDQNVIVDLSRVGSSETKSLIMGLLVLKLQEYRMEQRSLGRNADERLKHITVLEEAHNLLKRTSTDQTAEGSNLVGKSVEMIANAIAEMRTYGEGFIIADQSPGLLDLSVIRNTNTKIILRLPDFSDRELVGRSAGLTDDQIAELAKLEKGVAAVSQSGWLEPVLCKVDLYERKAGTTLKSVGTGSTKGRVSTPFVSKSLLDCIMRKELFRKGDRIDMRQLKEKVIRSRLSTAVKRDFLEYLASASEKSRDSLGKLLFDFLNAEPAVRKAKEESDIQEWVHSVAEQLQPSIQGYTKQQIDLAMELIVYELSERDSSYINLRNSFQELYRRKGGVF